MSFLFNNVLYYANFLWFGHFILNIRRTLNEKTKQLESFEDLGMIEVHILNEPMIKLYSEDNFSYHMKPDSYNACIRQHNNTQVSIDLDYQHHYFETSISYWLQQQQ